jgi:hypothetical protein
MKAGVGQTSMCPTLPRTHISNNELKNMFCRWAQNFPKQTADEGCQQEQAVMSNNDLVS